MPDKKQEETVKATAEIVRANDVPSAMEQFVPMANDVAEGFENMSTEHMARPRLALCQSQTPQKDESDTKYIKGLKEGDFFNSVTGENYGPTVRISPLIFFIYRLRFGNKKEYADETDGLMCQAQNGLHGIGTPGVECSKCNLRLWLDGKKPRCTEYLAYASLIIPSKGDIRPDNTVVLGLKSANAGIAKEWNAKMRMRINADKVKMPMWQGIYELSSKKQKFDMGSAYLVVPTPAGEHNLKTTNAHICRSAYYMVHDLFKSNKYAVDVSDLGRDAGE